MKRRISHICERTATGRRIRTSARASCASTLSYTWKSDVAAVSVVKSDAANFPTALLECEAQLPPTPIDKGQRVLLGFVLRSQAQLADDVAVQPLKSDQKPVTGPARGGEAIVTERDASPGRRRRLRRYGSGPIEDVLVPAAGVRECFTTSDHVQGKDSTRQRPVPPFIGCTAGDFVDGASGTSLLLAAIDIPSSVVVDPFTVSGPNLPPLAQYAHRLREDDTHVLLLASPSSQTREDVEGIVSRMTRLFPRALALGGTATSAQGSSSCSSVGQPLLLSSQLDVPSTVSVLGLALHGLGHSAGVKSLYHTLLGAVFSEVEFDGFLGMFLGKPDMARLFGVHARHLQKVRVQQTIVAQSMAGVIPAALQARVASTPSPAPALSWPAVPPPMPIFAIDRPLALGETMTMRIFEPRYRLMIKQHLEAGVPIAVSQAPLHVVCSGLEGAENGSTGAAAADTQPRTVCALPGDSAPLPGQVKGVYQQLLQQQQAQGERKAAAASLPDTPRNTSNEGSKDACRVGTVATVSALLEATPEGAYLLQLRGHRRVEWKASWVAPRSFGLLHGVGSWFDDIGHTALPSSPSGSTAAPVSTPVDPDTPEGREAALCTALCQAIAGIWKGQTLAAQLLKKILRDTPGVAHPEGASPEDVSWHYTAVLPVPLSEKQAWLEIRRTSARLARQLEYLNRRLDDLSFRTKGAAAVPEPGKAKGGA